MRIHLCDTSRKALRWKYGNKKFRVTKSGVLEVVVNGKWVLFSQNYDDCCDKIRELQEEYLSKTGNTDYYTACFSCAI